MKIIPLDGGVHNRRNFDCGQPSLNKFLLEQAQQAAKKYISKTFVLVHDDDPATILGYYTTCIQPIEPATIPEGKFGKDPVSMLLLARIAVDQRFQGKGFGRLLLTKVLGQARTIADTTALFGVVLDALDSDVEKFYLKFGFKVLTDNPLHLYMPIGTIREWLSEENSEPDTASADTSPPQET